MSTTESQEEPRKLDWGRLYRIVNVMPGKIAGFDRRGNPMDARGKLLPARESQKYVIQDGRVFDEAGAEIKNPPKEVTALVAQMRSELRTSMPGVTHEGRLYNCAAPGCGFRTSVEAFYRDHKRLHRDITAERWLELEGPEAGQRVPFSLSDFAEPADMMPQFTEGQGRTPPRRESAQGEG